MRALITLALVACDPVEPLDPSTASISLGTGFASFTALEDGAEIPLARGSQGGFHLDVALEMTGFDPAGAHLVYEVMDATRERVDINDGVVLKRRSLTGAGTSWLRLADRAFLGEPVSGQAEIRAVLERDGVTLEDRVTVRILDSAL